MPSQATTSAAASSPASSSVVATPTRRNVYQESVDALRAHFQRSCDISLERHRFRRRYQRPEESLQDYLTDLRTLAVPANFGPLQDENIREQFTAGVLSTQVRERLLLDSNLPFDQAIRIDLNIERTKAEAKELTIATEQQSTCHVAYNVQKVDYHRQFPRGSQEKREFLKRRFPQLQNRNFANSRDLSFEEHILRETEGRGVDLVLNSLAEEKLQASVRCLATHGRFLEIGKFDLSQNNALGMAVFLKNVSFQGIMLDALFGDDLRVAADKRRVIQLVREGIASGAVQPLDAVRFDRDRVEEAFRFMASGKHMGKVVLESCWTLGAVEECQKAEFHPPCAGRVASAHVTPAGPASCRAAVAPASLDPNKKSLTLVVRQHTGGTQSSWPPWCMQDEAEQSSKLF
ncbi:fatty acid synthase-like [Ixodes scapularis]